MDMIQQDHISIGIDISMIHSDHIGIGMVVSVEPYFRGKGPSRSRKLVMSAKSLKMKISRYV